MQKAPPSSESLSIAALIHRSRFVQEFTALFREYRRPLLLYGGAARDLLLRGAGVKPRDFDFVVDTDMIEVVKKAFPRRIVGCNRFGGLQLKWRDTQIDCWPIDATWAFREGGLPCNSWRDLAIASILDVDGVVIRISDHLEFECRPLDNARRSRTISICHHSTLNKTIALFRALVLGSKYNFVLGAEFWCKFSDVERYFDSQLFSSLARKRYSNEDPRLFLSYSLASVPNNLCQIRYTLNNITAGLTMPSQAEFEFYSSLPGPNRCGF